MTAMTFFIIAFIAGMVCKGIAPFLTGACGILLAIGGVCLMMFGGYGVITAFL